MTSVQTVLLQTTRENLPRTLVQSLKATDKHCTVSTVVHHSLFSPLILEGKGANTYLIQQ